MQNFFINSISMAQFILRKCDPIEPNNEAELIICI